MTDCCVYACGRNFGRHIAATGHGTSGVGGVGAPTEGSGGSEQQDGWLIDLASLVYLNRLGSIRLWRARNIMQTLEFRAT
jgi:hypothetical protein